MEDIKKTDEQWRRELTPEQFEVLRRGATERPFTGALLHNKADGSYACAACGNALFNSDTKFDSGSGWPSFTEPANAANVTLLEDRSHGMHRVEVRCKRCGSHLGHIFDDGPGPTGQRYCINSAALDFKPGAKT
ncbi:MAG: peptide-methionine (R)-S-oxide reductase MsrB [Candidatus Eremiobacteraeota bacterium]|nr:peptide-methionine (R)-S-oxide reductase MsrB [Candidatus Eremiobacteraeota bacterium]MBV8222215.1 peptide-methionine (R)-S-oxide reductase MsrB [Candidatus Eremiobacteraeota bacterium]